MIAFVLLQLLLVATPAPESTPTYARFCTISADTGTGSYIERIKAQDAQFHKTSPLSDTQVAESVQKNIGLPAAPTVIVRNVEQILVPNTPTLVHEEVLLADLSASPSRWWLAHVDARGTVSEVRPATERETRGAVGFPRSMAAYVLFNDVMGGDSPVQRQGCITLYKAWFEEAPGLLPSLVSAVTAPPPLDQELAVRVRAAWNAMLTSKSPQEGKDLTTETARLIGTNPEVESIYHEPGLPGDGIGPIDVVRIGARIHTYAIVDSSNPLKLSGPFCVVGDQRCASYYEWP
jgi:hypothetical protein